MAGFPDPPPETRHAWLGPVPLTRRTGCLPRAERTDAGRASQPDHFLLRYAGPDHLLTIAPTRAGKGVGAIRPNLLLADRPVIVIDPKGENYRVAARARNRFGPVWALDPFGVTGNESAAYNPLDLLDPGSERFAEDAAALADAIVSDPPGEVREAHWNEEAVALLSGLILLCASSEPPVRRNLARIRAYLTQPPKTFHQLLEAMQASDAAGGLAARATSPPAGTERAGGGLGPLDRPAAHAFPGFHRIAEATSRTDFRFADLARNTGSVFLILPPDRIPTHARWLRILVAQALGEILRLPQPPAKPVLFLLDECAALGRMPPLERAVGLMAGYGMQGWTIFQYLHQLRAIYGRAAGTFLSNAGIVQAFNVNDLETARWISSMLGADTEVYGGGAGRDGSRVARPLLTPDEVLNLPTEGALLLPQEGRPVLARKVRYYAGREFESALEQAIA